MGFCQNLWKKKFISKINLPKKIKTYTTARLILCQWQESDIFPFAEMNSDAEVMKYFPNIWAFEESLKMYNDCLNNKSGIGWYLVEEKISGKFIGFVGLNNPNFMPNFVEIGWRLKQGFWGKGYATEVAKKWLEIGFDEYGLKEIIPITRSDKKNWVKAR